jgi:flagellar basal body L-ring protein FlgH
MKKIIPLMLLAAGALLLLAGCDQMLESIYPDQTNKNNTVVTYTLPVEVRADPNTIPEWWNHDVWMQLTDSKGNSIWQDSLFQGDSYSTTVYASTTFNYIEGGDTQLLVWFDANDNGVFDSGEPSGSSYLYLDSSTSGVTDVITISY